MRILLSVLAVLLLVPTWSGPERLPLLDRRSTVVARPVAVPPEARRMGRVTLLGALELTSPAPGFGGFSAIALRGGRLTLLNDGGNWISFALAAGRPREATAGYLPDGPGIGWEKRDRDSESLAIDAAAGHAWVGFENANEIWRYDADLRRAQERVRPRAMARWRINSGAESLVRLRDGGFVVIGERGRRRSRLHEGFLFADDPTGGATPRRFLYRAPEGYQPSDAAELPGGDLIVVNRRFSPPYRFSAKLTIVPRRELRAGRVATGREIATIGAPWLEENWEGIAVARERGRTILWMVADEDVALLQRTLVMKLRLD